MSRAANGKATRIVGVLISIGLGIAAWKWPQSTDVTLAFVITLVGICVTLLIDSGSKSIDIETLLMTLISDRATQTEITRLSKKDEQISTRYRELIQDVTDLSRGTYAIAGLENVYLDDVKYINGLSRSESLRSTCPVSTKSPDAAWEQLSSPHYRASIEAHKRAARRHARVTRVYLFGTRATATDARVVAHLRDLEQARLDVRIIIRDEMNLTEREFDFLVFGERRVSVGLLDPDNGMVTGAVVHVDDDRVADYIERYDQMVQVAMTLDELVGPTPASTTSGSAGAPAPGS